jgi:hypothetical protein
MRKESGTPLYIISLNLDEATTAAKLEALGIQARIVVGCYEGHIETSAMIQTDDFSAKRTELVALLNEYTQQTLLYLDGQRNAYLADAPFFEAGVAGKYIGELVSRPQAQFTTLPNSYTLVDGTVYYVR